MLFVEMNYYFTSDVVVMHFNCWKSIVHKTIFIAIDIRKILGHTSS